MGAATSTAAVAEGNSEDTVAEPPAWADAVTAQAFASVAKEFGRSGFERARRKWGGELDCAGKRCLVLGADAPLGRAIAEGLARCGAAVHLTAPSLPDAEALRNVGRKFPPGHLHDSWMDFLYWDAELQA